MNVKGIATCYEMDEEVLTARLTALHEGWETTPNKIKRKGYASIK